MGRVVTGIVDDRAFQVKRQKSQGQEHGEGPTPDEPAPDGQCSQPIAPHKEDHGGIERRRRIEELLRNRPRGRKSGGREASALGGCHQGGRTDRGWGDHLEQSEDLRAAHTLIKPAGQRENSAADRAADRKHRPGRDCYSF
jgi:hypothetical protein